MSSNLIRLFVYGTLKRNQPNHYWLTKLENGYSKFLYEGRTKVKYPLIIGTRYNIPFLLNKPNVGNKIHGEVYEIDEKMLSNVDILEDYPRYYDREIQEIEINDGNSISCWVYLLRNFPEELLQKKFLTNYEDSEESRYCERCKRDSNILTLNDLNYKDMLPGK